MRTVIRNVLDYLDNMGPEFRVDHLWIYTDDN